MSVPLGQSITEDRPEDGEQLQNMSASNYSKPFGNYVPKLLDMLMDDSSTPHDQKSIPPHPNRSNGHSPPPELDVRCKKMLRQAEVHHTNGKLDAARNLCSKVIKLCPDSHYPYVILARISVNTDRTAYKNHLLAASRLYEHDPSVWGGLAELEAQSGNKHNAIKMYSKAIRDAPRDKNPHLRRINLAVELGEHERHLVLEYKKHMAECLPKSDFKDILQVCKELAERHCEEQAYSEAINVLQIPFKRIPDKVTPDLIDMISRIFFLTKQYEACLNFFLEYLDFTVHFDSLGSSPVVYKASPNVDISVKFSFIMCLLKLKLVDSAKPLMDETLVKGNLEKYAYAFFTIAEELMAAELWEQARNLWSLLYTSPTYALSTAVWSKYTECVEMLEKKRLENSAEPCLSAAAEELEETPLSHGIADE